ncbi:hypothetical protein GGR57DRAFT_454057 [Xylariaceae sp. FL1272]|nr:hypothetical protein GGR57DRAFT_454057 [Xylariaceae sp. FL1272]
MTHAWLDSLSEDWVSQPRSENSQLGSQADSPHNSHKALPPRLSPNIPPSPKNLPHRSSRIPRFNPGAPAERLQQHHQQQQHLIHSSSPNALSERSANNINIKNSRLLGLSKLSEELKPTRSGRPLSRSVSASTAGSVVHNSVIIQNKSQSASPPKGRETIPEWKKRIVLGELSYGESKDLFTSAGIGLENIFRPPLSPNDSPDDENQDAEERQDNTHNETTLPSSPPLYSRYREPSVEDSDESSDRDDAAQSQPELPRKTKFRQVEGGGLQGSSELDTVAEEEEPMAEEESRFLEAAGSSIISLRNKQHQEDSRKTNGQSMIKNEDFSPILIGRHTLDGKVAFAPMELPAHQLRKKLENLRRNQMILDPNPASNTSGSAPIIDGTENFEDTEDYVKNGGFLNVRRGGYSAEGSFRRRPLSPPVSTDISELHPESSLQASTPKQFATVRTERFASARHLDRPASPPSPSLPLAPHPSPEKRHLSTTVHGPSPLKLFGPYDTFTNQTLLRRISQFENQSSNMSCSTENQTPASPISLLPSRPVAPGPVPGKQPIGKNQPQLSYGHNEVFGAINNFGAGKLDNYEFDSDMSLSSAAASRAEEKENVTPPQIRVPSSQSLKFEIHEDVSAEGESIIIRRNRGKLDRSVSGHHLRGSKSLDGLHKKPFHAMDGSETVPGARSTRDCHEAKRPRTSPSKDPTPKRRRTLHKSDIAYGLEHKHTAMETVQSSHYNMQTVISKEHNHVQHAEPNLFENANGVSASPIPRGGPQSSTQKDRAPLAELDVSGRATAGPSAQQQLVDGSRKSSMKTQDFYDAAEEIMAMIRNKARPKSALSSVEESELESTARPVDGESTITDDSFQESTKDAFLRPPSRDGRPLPKMPTRQEDPELADQLRKYEEHSDVDNDLSESVRSMRLNKRLGEPQNLGPRSENGGWTGPPTSHSQVESDIISDMANVKISRNPDIQESSDKVTDFPSHSSRSSGTSTGRSIPSGSSRGSDSRRLIAPDVVSQLIGTQVGNMVFDEDQKLWHKVRAPRPKTNFLPSEDSEDDPFASIPDLTVNMTAEKKNLCQAMGLNRESLLSFLEGDESQMNRIVEMTASARDADADSDSEEHPLETPVEEDKEIEQEMSLHEDRIQKATPSRRRNLTIQFSSPIASIIQDVAHKDSNDTSQESEASHERPVRHPTADSFKRGRHTRVERSVSAAAAKSKSRSRSRGLPRSLSAEPQPFIPRPVSRIDEQDEDSIADYAGNADLDPVSLHEESAIVQIQRDAVEGADLSVAIETPARRGKADALATPIIHQNVGNLSLTPLSEFTVHQADKSCALEVSYIVDNKYLVTGDGSKKVMSKAVRDLVERITEVEPYEPEWESMHELNISDKHLDSLHMLDQFCTQVVTLDVSNNSISHLDGVPQSVRNLQMTNNLLSELTAWRHLMNLQYVDVSNNQIKSLYALKDLVHLRTLRADNNQITSLDGIKFHDSLETLRVRNNFITSVDLDGTKLQRLVELDLENNQISSFKNCDQLTCLTTLNLQNNHLGGLILRDNVCLTGLRQLKISDNEWKSFDLAVTPALRLLYADRNRISSITGMQSCRRLDSLSLREQKGDEILDTAFLNYACEVRKLFLSGNRLSSFNPTRDFLNLQYLELANCGLQSLIPELGQMLPNLRVLNINFNAIESLDPLCCIPRLKRLFAAGNRLVESGLVANSLAQLPHLSRLDLRDNGMTLGFYPPTQTHIPHPDANQPDSFTLPDADVNRYEKFAKRNDLRTRMRKRIYDLVLLGRLSQLKMLDGLPTVSDIGSKRDDVWEALVEAGIVASDHQDDQSSDESSR